MWIYFRNNPMLTLITSQPESKTLGQDQPRNERCPPLRSVRQADPVSGFIFFCVLNFHKKA